MNKKSMNKMSFEEAIKKLEEIVKHLERGELTLDESLTQFSEGIALSQHCLARLENAEQQIDKMLREEEGTIIEKPLQLQEDAKC
ncbi:hypothetical protein P22_0359 [Propionispora sp. 2/2-37]|uniref:exodeoxyribonuclease VII small subunit n=1 Tax=Propionispora sp. 2/2-37 TaxID=1677858 RepID=UPI0006BF9960|nr:exodeoxyribonuclease VII small subunit [Propionispora sp. 2/2-37]CUH94293.1 hypothetical protein P22_0359 [Propionispora sp. 2/2-37]